VLAGLAPFWLQVHVPGANTLSLAEYVCACAETVSPAAAKATETAIEPGVFFERLVVMLGGQ
jgi:hypothetical protein